MSLKRSSMLQLTPYQTFVENKEANFQLFCKSHLITSSFNVSPPLGRYRNYFLSTRVSTAWLSSLPASITSNPFHGQRFRQNVLHWRKTLR